MTLVAYPLIALSALVAGFKLTAEVVSIGTFLLCAVCAAVIARRHRREEAAGIVPEPLPGRRIQIGELVVPLGAILTAMLIAVASVHVLPRKPPEEFNTIALDGTWALTSHVVPANPNRDIGVSFRVDNRTRSTHDYEITAGVVDGPAWSPATVTLGPGESWVGTTTGRVAKGSCRSRLEIDLHVAGDDTDYAPLAVFLRDATLDC